MSYKAVTITPYTIKMYSKKYPDVLKCYLCGRTFSPYEIVYVFNTEGRRVCASCLDMYTLDVDDNNPMTIIYVFIHPDGTKEECVEVV